MSDDEMPQEPMGMEGDDDYDEGDMNLPIGGADKLPEGVQKEVITEAPDSNWQKPKNGDEVTVHYVGTLESDGSEFDSSRGRDQPFTFTLGKGEVIKGWDLGVATMKKGEVAKFTLKPEFAYGEAGSPPKIPANTTLVFEVELISWVSKDDLFLDGGVIKAQVKEGSGWKKPKSGDEVRLSLKVQGKEGAVLDEKTGVDYVLGSGAFGEFSRVADKALEGMKKGEEVQLTCSPTYAYGEQKEGTLVNLTLEEMYDTKDVSFAKDRTLMKKQIVEGQGYDNPKDGCKVTLKVEEATDGAAALPGFSPATLEFPAGNGEVCDALEFAVFEMKKGERAVLTCTAPETCREERLGLKEIKAQQVVLVVELLDFEKGKDTWSMSEEEKVDFGTARKDVGSNLFRQGRIPLALERYRKAGDMFNYIDNFKEETKAKAKALKQACDLNLAACQLKLRDFSAAKASCNKVLKDDPDMVKALFRRAQADLELKNYMECMRDLKRVAELEPQNREARRLLEAARAGQKEEDVRSKGMFAKMCQGLGKGIKGGVAEQAEEEPRKRGRTTAADAPASGGEEKPEEATGQRKEESPEDAEQPDVSMEPAAHEPQFVSAH